MQTKVIYNAECPICSREVAAYRRYSEAHALPLTFEGLQNAGAAVYGIDEDQAARRLHVVQNGEILAGVPAFIALWGEMPRLRWLACLTSLPVVRPIAEALYERVLAPLLYRLHRRRSDRRGRGRPPAL